jgi:hypothetical protein
MRSCRSCASASRDASSFRHRCSQPTAASDTQLPTVASDTVDSDAPAVRVATMTTLCHIPNSMLEAFILWHLHIGFTRVYLYFDDEDDPGIAVARKLRREHAAVDSVSVVACDERLRHEWSQLELFDSWGRTAEKMVEVRQMYNCEHAVRRAQ